MKEKHIIKSKPHTQKYHSKNHRGKKRFSNDEESPVNIIDHSNFDIENVDNFDNFNANSENNEEEEEIRPKINLDNKTRERLKRKITEWLDNDDKIKLLNANIKKFKDQKKEQEEIIISMLNKLGMNESKIDVHGEDGSVRSRVYRHKSVTKGSLKEEIIKKALMEIIRDEKKVDQYVKKIESKRPINERYYLKRTKGNKN